MTKHTDTEEGTGTHPLTFIWRHRSFGYPEKNWQCLALDPEAYLSHSSASVRTNCTHDAAHNMHMNTDINTYTSLNALLCPRRSDLEMKRCINKTLPAVKKRSMQFRRLSGDPAKIWGSGVIWLHSIVSPHFPNFRSSCFVLFHLSGSDLAVCFSCCSLTDGCCPAFQTCGSLRVQHCTFCWCSGWVPEREGPVWSGTYTRAKELWSMSVILQLC